MNSMVYGQLFPHASDIELESLRRLGARWKVSKSSFHGEVLLSKIISSIAIRKRRQMGL